MSTPPTVLMLCLWAWRGLLAALWAGAEECRRVASGDGIVDPAFCLLSYSITASADLDHNDPNCDEKVKPQDGRKDIPKPPEPTKTANDNDKSNFEKLSNKKHDIQITIGFKK
jgi:hypothetical protein